MEAVSGKTELPRGVWLEPWKSSIASRWKTLWTVWTNGELLLGDYSPGRFAWILKNPAMFDTPISACGQQGWWEWPFV